MSSPNHHKGTSTQRGNIFTILFGAVAVIGIITASTMNLISGPIKTASKANSINMTNASMQAAGRILIIDAANQANSGDTDSDGTIEPRAFTTVSSGGITGGGSIPTTVGASRTDPWGNLYGYCVWNNGTSFSALTNILAGAVTTGTPVPTVIAIVSAGPDKIFQTSCVAYSSGATTGDAVTTGVIKVSGSDDIVMKWSYAEALAAGLGLWAIKTGSPTTTNISKNVEIYNTTESTPTVSINKTTGAAIFNGSLATDTIVARTTSGIQFNTSVNANAMRISSAGSVGIGTTSPGYLLDVVGDVRATTFISTSDARLKKDVTPLENALELVTKLHGVHFNWKKPNSDAQKGLQMGLIAQEVEKVFPELVFKDAQGFKAVNYSALVAPLIEAVKDLKHSIADLETENTALKNKIKKMDARLQALEDKAAKP